MEFPLAEKDIVMISKKELKRLHLIKKAIAGEMSQVEIAKLTWISVRHVGRIVRRVEGDLTPLFGPLIFPRKSGHAVKLVFSFDRPSVRTVRDFCSPVLNAF
jgi:hypothetical protein